MPLNNTLVWSTLALAGWSPASAHISYVGHDFGSFTGNTAASVTLTGKSVVGNSGWADGTDDDWGDSHKTRPFRFTLLATGKVTVSVSASTAGGTRLGDLLPGYSIYRGLAHLPPASPDHDYADLTTLYIYEEFGTFKEGAFRALTDWKIANDEGVTYDDLTSFTYCGHAADGSAANFGSAPGINGDGLANGTVTGTFTLPAGDYTFFVGGSQYSDNTNTLRGLAATVSVAPFGTFEQWTAAQGLAGSAADPRADSDGDGLSNLVEYALGGSPSVSDRAGRLPSTSLVSGKLRLTAVIRGDDPGLAVAAETNTDLNNPAGWVSTGIQSVAGVDQTGVPAGFLRVVYEVNSPVSQPRFLRLRFER